MKDMKDMFIAFFFSIHGLHCDCITHTQLQVRCKVNWCVQVYLLFSLTCTLNDMLRKAVS